MKLRLDRLVVERGLAPGRDEAQRLILAGRVRVNGQTADKPGREVPSESEIALEGRVNPHVSRGGLKLAAALERFGLTHLEGLAALDIGASTGGFTDCLLQHGAARVVAVDTGRGKLHERLLANPRVRLHENTNARYVTLETIGGERSNLIAIDVSFISLKLILPPCEEILNSGGSVVALVKPQFEAGRKRVGKRGVVRDPVVHREVLLDLIEFCKGSAWLPLGLMVSPILGGKGNVEFFIHLVRPPLAEAAPAAPAPEIDVERTLKEAYDLQNRLGSGAESGIRPEEDSRE